MDGIYKFFFLFFHIPIFPLSLVMVLDSESIYSRPVGGANAHLLMQSADGESLFDGLWSIWVKSQSG